MHTPAHDRSSTRGVRVGVGAFLIWGFLTVYWKQLDQFEAVELIGWRMVCAAVVMATVVSVRGSWGPLRAAFRNRVTAVRLVVAALLLTVNWGSYVWAVVNDRVLETALGYFISPLATMAVGVVVLRETPTSAQRLAAALAFVAVVILTVSNGRPPWVALVIAGSWSAYALAKRQVPLDSIDSLAGETFVLLAPACIALTIVSSRSASVVNSAEPVDWVFVLGTGIVTAIPLLLFASAAKSIPFTLLGPLNLVVPVIGFGLGWLVYDEAMPADRFVGFAFVWVALVVVMWDRYASHRDEVSAVVQMTS